MKNQYFMFPSPWYKNSMLLLKDFYVLKKKALNLRKFNQINLHITNLKTRNHIINCETM